MAAATPAPPLTNARSEVKLRAPKDYTGDRTKALDFIQSCDLYFGVNDTTYDTDRKKISFALSFMTGGGAAAWKKQRIAEYTATDAAWPTWAAFKAAFETAFSPVSDEAAARAELKVLYQDGDIDDYIAQFRAIAARTGLTQETAVIEYFYDGLDPSIVQQIFLKDTIPTTLEANYAAAAKIYQNQQRARHIIAKGRDRTGASTKSEKEKKDPEVKVTISRLTVEERKKHMEQGLCFRCHKTGHRAQDHNTDGSLKQGVYANAPRKFERKFEPKKRTGAQAYAQIRTMIADLPEEEKEICIASMEEQGF